MNHCTGQSVSGVDHHLTELGCSEALEHFIGQSGSYHLNTPPDDCLGQPTPLLRTGRPPTSSPNARREPTRLSEQASTS